MALLNLVYRDQIFPREAYRLSFERLLEQLPERQACRTMVELLSLAHEHNCEAQLAQALQRCLDDGQLPNLDALCSRFEAKPASAMPEVSVRLAPLSDYEALLDMATEVAA
jgi:hypothetical protein